MDRESMKMLRIIQDKILEKVLKRAEEKAIPCGEVSYSYESVTVGANDVPAVLISDLKEICAELKKEV